MQARAARPEDLDPLVPLLREMEAHYGNPPQSDAATRARLRQVLFGTPPLTRLLLAVENGEALGFVTCNTSFPSPALGVRLVIEDLYVGERHRSRGLGMALLRAAAELAEELGAGELGWTTDPNNAGAQRFYDRLGARRVEKVVYRIDAALLRPGVAS